MARFAAVLVRRRIWLLVVALAIFAWASFSARRVEFDRSLENMFAVDDPVLPGFRRLKRTFHAGDVVLAAYADDKVFSTDGIARADPWPKKSRVLRASTSSSVHTVAFSLRLWCCRKIRGPTGSLRHLPVSRTAKTDTLLL